MRVFEPEIGVPLDAHDLADEVDQRDVQFEGFHVDTQEVVGVGVDAVADRLAAFRVQVHPLQFGDHAVRLEFGDVFGNGREAVARRFGDLGHHEISVAHHMAQDAAANGSSDAAAGGLRSEFLQHNRVCLQEQI